MISGPGLKSAQHTFQEVDFHRFFKEKTDDLDDLSRWDIREHKGQIQNTSVKKYSELFFALFCRTNSKHKRNALFCSILTGEGRFLSNFS